MEGGEMPLPALRLHVADSKSSGDARGPVPSPDAVPVLVPVSAQGAGAGADPGALAGAELCFRCRVR